MNAKEIIKAWGQDCNILYTELPKVYAPNYYLVNGKDKTLGGHTVIDKDAIVELHSSYSTCVGKKSKEGKFIPIDEFNKKMEEFSKYQEDEDDVDGDDNWTDIDQEYLCKKFLKEFSENVMETVNKVEKVNFEVIENVKPINEFLLPLRKLGGDIRNTLFVYQREKYALSLLKDYFESVGLKHTDNDYLKEGEYNLKSIERGRFYYNSKDYYLTVHMGFFDDFKSRREIVGTPEELLERQNTDKNEVLKELKLYFKKNTPLNEVTVGDVKARVGRIADYLRDIHVSGKSNNESLKYALSGIYELNKTLEKVILES